MLDAFFRKYAWIASSLLVVAAAWLCARTVNTVVAASIRPRPHIDLSAAPSAPPPAPPAALDLERLYALFGQKPPRPPELAQQDAPPPPPRNCGDRRAVPVRTTLRAQLVAGVLAERPEWSIVTLLDPSTRESGVYGVGDRYQTATLLGVERMQDPRDATGAGFRIVAILCNNGQKEYVDFDAAAPSPAPGFPAPPATAGAPPPGGMEAGAVKSLGGNRYEIPKRVLEQQLANLNDIATQARIVPSFKNGVANGFKLFSIQPGSIYASIGIDNGDVIQRINGFEINSPDKALEIYQKLRDANHVTIDLERNGQTIRKDYNITGP